MNTGNSKTDLRILKTQKALCDSFMELSAKKNFEDITVQELCDKAMVRRATFYKHFNDKYDFFDFFVRYIQGKMVDEFYQTLDSEDENASMETFFTYLFQKLVDFLQEHKKMVNSLKTSNAFAALLEILTIAIQQDICNYLAEQEKNGARFPAGVNTLSSFLSGGIIQITWQWFSDGAAFPVSQLIEEYQMLIHNLLNPVTVPSIQESSE